MQIFKLSLTLRKSSRNGRVLRVSGSVLLFDCLSTPKKWVQNKWVLLGSHSSDRHSKCLTIHHCLRNKSLCIESRPEIQIKYLRSVLVKAFQPMESCIEWRVLSSQSHQSSNTFAPFDRFLQKNWMNFQRV